MPFSFTTDFKTIFLRNLMFVIQKQFEKKLLRLTTQKSLFYRYDLTLTEAKLTKI